MHYLKNYNINLFIIIESLIVDFTKFNINVKGTVYFYYFYFNI